jgi:GTP-binding protein Era
MTDSTHAGAAPAETRCGFVALTARQCRQIHTRQRAGQLRVTIVSRKVQTTRALIRGIVIGTARRSSWSIRPALRRNETDRAMVSTPPERAHDADLVLRAAMPSGIDEEAEAIIGSLPASSIRKSWC